MGCRAATPWHARHIAGPCRSPASGINHPLVLLTAAAGGGMAITLSAPQNATSTIENIAAYSSRGECVLGGQHQTDLQPQCSPAMGGAG